MGLALNAALGQLYIADLYNYDVRVMSTSTLAVTTVIGGGPNTQQYESYGVAGSTDGVGVEVLFDFPTALAWDPVQNTLYIADTGNSRIRALQSGEEGGGGRRETRWACAAARAHRACLLPHPFQTASR